jgi:hypothetical protein
MPTLQEEQFFTELAAGHSGPPIPEAKRVYFQTRLRNRLFNYILGKFVAEQKNGLTKAALGRRIGKPPEMINRWLGAPSNLTLDTLSDLLLGISSEELVPQSETLLRASWQNQLPAISIKDMASSVTNDSKSVSGGRDPSATVNAETTSGVKELPTLSAAA